MLLVFSLLERLPAIPLCPSRWLLNVDCPTCGTTRAIHNILHFEFYHGWTANPVAYVVLIAIILRLLQLFTKNSFLQRILQSGFLAITVLTLFFALGYYHFFTTNYLRFR